MNTYIAILRGINVSGHKMIKMEALKLMFEELKFRNTKTYIQSGNVVFQGKKTPVQTLERKITEKIIAKFGFDVPVLVMEMQEVKDVLENNPFLKKRKEDITKLHVTFLATAPLKALAEKLNETVYAPDEFILSGAAIYLFCPNGYGNTKLNNGFFENKLKVTATTRNWKTSNELYKLAKAMDGGED
jgi:uncharacterized protein (DUF1697 family)